MATRLNLGRGVDQSRNSAARPVRRRSFALLLPDCPRLEGHCTLTSLLPCGRVRSSAALACRLLGVLPSCCCVLPCCKEWGGVQGVGRAETLSVKLRACAQLAVWLGFSAAARARCASRALALALERWPSSLLCRHWRGGAAPLLLRPSEARYQRASVALAASARGCLSKARSRSCSWRRRLLRVSHSRQFSRAASRAAWAPTWGSAGGYLCRPAWSACSSCSR